jgi:teichuronic acid biosynthesis glycosyltransferase TuaH
MSEPRDVVFTFTTASWADARRRGMCFPPDRFAETLLVHPRVRRLLVANPFRSLPGLLARRVSGGVEDEGFPSNGRARLYTPPSLRRGEPSSVAGVARRYRHYDELLRRAAAKAGLERPVVITSHGLVAGFAPFEWAGGVTFYADDDFSAHPEHAEQRGAYLEAYSRVGASGRRVCAVSQSLIELIEPTGASAVVPNGIDPSEWESIAPPPDWMAGLPRPHIAYVGTLDDRVDWRQVRRIAERFNTGTVVLVGYAPDLSVLEPIRDVPNVHLKRTVPRREINAVLGGADVCLVPHRRTPLTESMSPLKLYEYLAAGRPVAATDLAPMRGIDDRVVTVPEGDDFAAAVERALELGPAPEAQRREFLREHAWRSRHERILDIALA